jgi:cell division protein FtsW
VTATSVRHPGEFRWETRLLAVVTMMLVLFGIAACGAAGSYLPDWFDEAKDQLTGAVAGGVAFLALAYLDYNHLRRFAAPLFWATVAGLVVIVLVNIAFPGRPGPGMVQQLVPYINGSRRWINVGVQVQVSEVARLTMPIFVAAVAANLGPRIRSFREGFLKVMWPIALVAGLVVLQPNRSMAVLLMTGGVAVAFIAGVRLVHLLLVAGAAIPCSLSASSPPRRCWTAWRPTPSRHWSAPRPSSIARR